MATKTMLHRVAKAITGLSSEVSNTFVQQARTITDAACEAFGSVNWDIPKDEIKAIVSEVREASAWKGTSSEAARMSETQAIVKAYPFLGTAADVFKREYGELRRNHLLKVARLCPQSETATDAGLLAVEFFNQRDKDKNGGGKTPAEKVSAGLKQAINNATDATLKAALYRLANKHNIKVA